MYAYSNCSGESSRLRGEDQPFDRDSESGSNVQIEKFPLMLGLKATYESWNIYYHKARIRILKGPISLSMELSDSCIIHVSQTPLASTYESARRGLFHTQKLASRMWILPRKVRGEISSLLGRESHNWTVVEIVDQRQGFHRHVRLYQIVLRGT